MNEEELYRNAENIGKNEILVVELVFSDFFTKTIYLPLIM